MLQAGELQVLSWKGLCCNPPGPKAKNKEMQKNIFNKMRKLVEKNKVFAQVRIATGAWKKRKSADTHSLKRPTAMQLGP